MVYTDYMKKIEVTLAILRKNKNVLLAMCKRGFSEGKYNGVGGKVEKGETPEQAMIRETEEEIFVTPIVYEKMGINEFVEFVKGEKTNVIFHLYFVTEWEGEPRESDEMVPKWFDEDSIPYDKMFPDDQYWLPPVLAGKKIRGFFEFDEDWKMISKRIEEVSGSDE